LNNPISEVKRTCVPPHSSRENEPSPTSTIRTTSPYFSPNSAIAPSRRASVGEIEAQLVGADVGAGLVDVRAEAPTQRRVQQVGRGVVALGGVAGGAVDVGADALTGP